MGLLETAHEVGRGFGGFFDFGDAMGGGIGVAQVIGENVGVGADDTEKVVESVGDRFHATGGERSIVAGVAGSEIHRRTLSEMRLSFICGMGSEERDV